MSPAPVFSARIPAALPVTEVAATDRSDAVAFAWIPSPLVPTTAPLAVTRVAPLPLFSTQIPWRAPVTAAAVTARPAPETLVARIPALSFWLPLPVTVPVTAIETEPPPVFLAVIPLAAPEMAPPSESCSSFMPPEPV